MDKLFDDDNIILNLPVKISYRVLEDVLQEKLVGEQIGMEDSKGTVKNYAEVLGANLGKSQEPNFDLTLNLKLKTLTTLFKNKEVTLLVHIRLGFDEVEQVIDVEEYELEGQSKSWLMDNSLETLANTLIYKKIKNKMKLDLKPHINEQLGKANQKLGDEMEAAPGVFLSGNVNTLKVAEIIPGDSLLLILLEISAYGFIDVKEIKL
ncbi:hypothetical protein APR41_08925 [Salegentibacter salinarum]|uniref:DUF4403 family protein n=1 Tax=Salegentibacter salinarum TaxID=447422 RepID=A0A2N0TP22_9FLAO|nr:DUF4403 family protein [Salegentibacter salinarum]PKD16456.1 hypothetical protein APR41_08925 [Salegentibacter salinarum]SKB64562.1 protein of unknown function [Salegentibacter salinarum]